MLNDPHWCEVHNCPLRQCLTEPLLKDAEEAKEVRVEKRVSTLEKSWIEEEVTLSLGGFCAVILFVSLIVAAAFVSAVLLRH